MRFLSIRQTLPLIGVALLPLAALPAFAQTSTFALPLTTGSGNKLDVGTFVAGQTYQITATGSGDLVDSRFQVNPDGTLAAPAGGVYAFANFGATCSSVYGGDGINHFVGGGSTYDQTGSGFAFAGPQTTDTTNPADIRFGSVVGTFSAAPGRNDWFYIGKSGTFVVPAAGDLYLAVADTVNGDNHGSYAVTLTTPAAVPEASTNVSLGLLLVLGLGGMAVAAKRRKSAAQA